MQHEIIPHWSLENTHNALVVEEQQQKKKLKHKVAHSGALLHVQHMKMFYECFLRLSFVSCRSPQTPNEKRVQRPLDLLPKGNTHQTAEFGCRKVKTFILTCRTAVAALWLCHQTEKKCKKIETRVRSHANETHVNAPCGWFCGVINFLCPNRERPLTLSPVRNSIALNSSSCY